MSYEFFPTGIYVWYSFVNGRGGDKKTLVTYNKQADIILLPDIPLQPLLPVTLWLTSKKKARYAILSVSVLQILAKWLSLHCVFHSIRFKVNKDWNSAEFLFYCPYVKWLYTVYKFIPLYVCHSCKSLFLFKLNSGGFRAVMLSEVPSRISYRCHSAFLPYIFNQVTENGVLFE